MREVFNLLKAAEAKEAILAIILDGNVSHSLRAQTIAKEAALGVPATGVILVQAMLLAHYEQEPDILASVLYCLDHIEVLAKDLQRHTYPIAIIGTVKAAAWFQKHQTTEQRESQQFVVDLPTKIGLMLKRFSAYEWPKGSEISPQLCGDFQNAINEYLEPVFSNPWAAHASKILAQLTDADVLRTPCHEFFGKLTHRVLACLPDHHQIRVLHRALTTPIQEL